MNDINDLKDIWKQLDCVSDNFSNEKTSGELIGKLKKLETFQNKINRIKIFVMLVALTMIGFSVSQLEHITIMIYAGLAIIIAGITFFMWKYLKDQFKIDRLDFTTNNQKFIKDAVQMLEKQNAIFKTPFKIFAITLIIGINVLLLGLDLDNHERLILHTNASSILSIASFLGYRIRMWRIKKEITPLLHELNSAKEKGE